MAGTGGNTTDARGVLVLTDAVEEPGQPMSPGPEGDDQPPRSLLGRLRSVGARRNAPTAEASVTNGSAKKKKGAPPYIDDRKILRVGRKRLGIGLLWIAQQEGVSLREAVRSNAIAGETPDLYVRRRKAQQIGLAFSNTGLAQGHGVAATAFRMGKDDDWIAVFALEERTAKGDRIPVWWLVGHREGQVYEDRLIYETTAAKAALEDHLTAPGWVRVLAPADWAMPYTEPGTLDDWFSPRKAAQLTSTSPLRAYLVPAAAALLLMASSAGGYLYWQNLQEQERLFLEMQQRQRERDRLAALQTPPWVGTPTVAEFLRACSHAVERNLMLVPGWTPGDLVCAHDAGRVTLTSGWSRAGGRSAWIVAAAQAQGLDISLDASLTSAGFSQEVSVAERADVDFEPLDANTLDQILRYRFDTLLLDAGLTEVAARPAPDAAQQQGAPIWNYHALTFRTSAMLDEYLAIVGDIPAIVPERLVYNPTNHEWALDIRIYHPPIGGLR